MIRDESLPSPSSVAISTPFLLRHPASLALRRSLLLRHPRVQVTDKMGYRFARIRARLLYSADVRRKFDKAPIDLAADTRTRECRPIRGGDRNACVAYRPAFPQNAPGVSLPLLLAPSDFLP